MTDNWTIDDIPDEDLEKIKVNISPKIEAAIIPGWVLAKKLSPGAVGFLVYSHIPGIDEVGMKELLRVSDAEFETLVQELINAGISKIENGVLITSIDKF